MFTVFDMLCAAVVGWLIIDAIIKRVVPYLFRLILSRRFKSSFIQDGKLLTIRTVIEKSIPKGIIVGCYPDVGVIAVGLPIDHDEERSILAIASYMNRIISEISRVLPDFNKDRLHVSRISSDYGDSTVALVFRIVE